MNKISDARKIWCVIASPVAALLVIFGIVGIYHLIEPLILFFWFSLIFSLIDIFYKWQAKRIEFIRGTQYFFGWMFAVYIVVVCIARFVYEIPYVIAYLYPIAVCIILPYYTYLALHPYYEKWFELNRIHPNKIFEAASKSSHAQAFLHKFPDARAFVFHHSRLHDTAKCILFYRHPRPERENMNEDIVQELSINMKQTPLRTSLEVCNRYICRDGEEGSTVINLPPVQDIGSYNPNVPLEPIQLDQFDSAFERYPILNGLPLAIVLHQDEYVEVEINHSGNANA